MVRKKELELEYGYNDRAKLLKPWTLADKSAKRLKVVDVLQYVPASKRVWFMEEVYRVLADGGEATFVVNYYASAMAVADPEAEWPPLCEQSFLFFNKKWRENNKIGGKIKCDFDFNYGFAWAPDVASRSTEVQSDFARYRLNVIQKLQVVMTKAKQ